MALHEFSSNASGVDTPKCSSSRSRVSSGRRVVFTSLTANDGLHPAAPEGLRPHLLRQRDVHVPHVARLGAGHLRPEVLGHPVGQGELLLDLDPHLLSLFISLPPNAMVTSAVTVSSSSAAGGSPLRHELAVRFEQAGRFSRLASAAVKVCTGRRSFSPLVIRQVELGPHLDVELVDERPFLGDLDLRRVEFGRAEGGDGLLLGQLLQAGHQHLRLDLLGHAVVVLLLDHLAGRFARPEARGPAAAR